MIKKQKKFYQGSSPTNKLLKKYDMEKVKDRKVFVNFVNINFLHKKDQHVKLEKLMYIWLIKLKSFSLQNKVLHSNCECDICSK